jgi:hypothetical protein
LDFGSITAFNTGIKWNGLSAGCQYNQLRARQFRYCINALVGASSGGGWTNELHHQGLTFAHSNADINSSSADVVCITIPASANGWSFHGCSFENASYDETDLYALKCGASAGYVTLSACRFERDGSYNQFKIEVDASPNGSVLILHPTGDDFTFGTNAINKVQVLPGIGYVISPSSAVPTATQGAPAAIADGDTAITWANLQSLILTMASSTGGRAPTVPTGTAVNGGMAIGQSIDWSFINTGNQTVTITAAAGHTLVGGMALAAGTQGMFRTRCTATNTAITYRLA